MDFYGTSSFNATGEFNQTRSFLSGTIIVMSNAIFRIDHFVLTPLTNQGLGIGTQNGAEIYTQVKITKIAD